MRRGLAQSPRIVMHALTPERWPDLEAVFNARGCSVARGCWCMYYRRTGTWQLGGKSRAEANRASLKALAKSDPPAGLLGYRGRTPVGWISLGPRRDYHRLENSRVMKAVDDKPVWSVICFVVPSEHRRQGVAKAMLAGAIAYAKRRGVKLLEAYPLDKDGALSDESLWFGAKSMYDA